VVWRGGVRMSNLVMNTSMNHVKQCCWPCCYELYVFMYVAGIIQFSAE